MGRKPYWSSNGRRHSNVFIGLDEMVIEMVIEMALNGDDDGVVVGARIRADGFSRIQGLNHRVSLGVISAHERSIACIHS